MGKCEVREAALLLHSANPGSFDQMLSFIGNGETLFSF